MRCKTCIISLSGPSAAHSPFYNLGFQRSLFSHCTILLFTCTCQWTRENASEKTRSIVVRPVCEWEWVPSQSGSQHVLAASEKGLMSWVELVWSVGCLYFEFCMRAASKSAPANKIWADALSLALRYFVCAEYKGLLLFLHPLHFIHQLFKIKSVSYIIIWTTADFWVSNVLMCIYVRALQQWVCEREEVGGVTHNTHPSRALKFALCVIMQIYCHGISELNQVFSLSTHSPALCRASECARTAEARGMCVMYIYAADGLY